MDMDDAGVGEEWDNDDLDRVSPSFVWVSEDEGFIGVELIGPGVQLNEGAHVMIGDALIRLPAGFYRFARMGKKYGRGVSDDD